MTRNEYTHLKEQIVLSVGSSERHSVLLHQLKDLFRDDINSTRRFEKIVFICDLLHVLEIRDILSEDDIRPLLQIAQRTPNSKELLRCIESYEASHIPIDYVNYYASDNIPHTNNIPNSRERVKNIKIPNPYQAVMSDSKIQRIYETIEEEIGGFWRDLGRNLNVRECDIDKINREEDTLAEKAARIMKIYEKKADPQRWFFVLCEALEKASRRDLSRSLQEIMTMNI